MSLSSNLHPEIIERREQSQPFVLTPKHYALVVLLVLMAIAGVNSVDRGGLINAGIGMVTALIFDGIFALLRGNKRLFSDGGLITGLIVALVLSSSASWYVIIATTLIALLSKHLLKIKRKPMFNPAAFGLFLAIFLFSSEQSWWGAFSELPAFALALFLLAGFLVTGRVNKFPAVFTFLGTYFGFFLVLGVLGAPHAGDAFRVPFVNSALFLAFFMVSDPPTTPNKTSSQVYFGIITSVVATLVYLLYGGLAYLFVGLLVANAYHAVSANRQQRQPIQI